MDQGMLSGVGVLVIPVFNVQTAFHPLIATRRVEVPIYTHIEHYYE